MKQIEWNDSLSIGVRFIDEHHKALLQRLNDVSAAIESMQGEREITRTLSFLSDYAKFHFEAEEKKMEATGYPGLDHQLVEHKKFIDTLKNLEDDFEEEDASKALAVSLDTFLYNWLLHHIKVIDKKFGEYLTEKGLAE